MVESNDYHQHNITNSIENRWRVGYKKDNSLHQLGPLFGHRFNDRPLISCSASKNPRQSIFDEGETDLLGIIHYDIADVCPNG